MVVSAGPTHEPIDDVRYLGNVSSGRMGFALAEAAAKRGHAVELIAGPVELSTPAGVGRTDVQTAREMLTAVRAAFREADALFMCAAVADWRPRRRRRGKWRKEKVDGDSAILELVRNPDILASVARRKGGRLVVGFALETGDGLRRARAKMERKGVDHIVLNHADVLGSERTSVSLLSREGGLRRIGPASKRAVARELVKLVDSIDSAG